jgi:Cu+-exporting ATPase
MIKKETIKISGMSCAACAARIEKGLNRLEGVKQAAVNLATEKASIEYDDQAVKPESFGAVIKKLGYEVIEEKAPSNNKAELKITGMSCAACSAKIEKKLNKLDGIQKASVNLATEKASVEYDNTRIKVSEMIKAIELLGYNAERAEEVSRDREKEQREKEIRRLRTELAISAILSSPLIFAMLLNLLNINVAFLHNEYFQLVIATPIQFIIGFRFYRNAYHALRSKSANMDVLIAMGTSAAYFSTPTRRCMG